MRWFALDGKCHDGCPALRYERECETYRYGERFCRAWADAGLYMASGRTRVFVGEQCVMWRLRNSLIYRELSFEETPTGKAAKDVQEAITAERIRERVRRAGDAGMVPVYGVEIPSDELPAEVKEKM